MIFQSVYNGPVQYFARLIREEEIVIEKYDSYLKQTFRNRCRILGANGPLDLTIPVINIPGKKMLLKDVRIDYSQPWQKIHWKGITSSYASSPFFQFIMDDLAGYYERRHRFLVDLNHGLLTTTLGILGLKRKIVYTEYFMPVRDDGSDPRFFIHPKKDFRQFDPEFSPVPYNQVFIEKHGFIPNLSIIDLLFNEGLHSRAILEKSLVNAE